MKRTLALKKDTLTELGSADLRSVIGGIGTLHTFPGCEVNRITTVIGGEISDRDIPSLQTPCS